MRWLQAMSKVRTDISSLYDSIIEIINVRQRNQVISIKITVLKKDVIPSAIWWRGGNSKSYTITSRANGFYESSDACETVDGYLASIMNENDQEAVNIAIKNLKPQNETFLWIGLNMEGSNTWIWQNKALISTNYINWSPGQPSSINALQACGAAGQGGAWFSIGCDEKHHGICEKIDSKTALTNGVTIALGGEGSTNKTLKVLNFLNKTKNGNETKVGKENTREDEQLMKPGQMGNQQTNGKKQKQDGNNISTKDAKCNLIKFINNYNHPVIISRYVDSNNEKEFRIVGKSYKLKTVIKTVQEIDKMEPVVYTAKDARKEMEKKLLLDNRDSFTLVPGDCDGEFIDVLISSKTSLPLKGLILQENMERNNSKNDAKVKKEEERTIKKCKVETFGGNSEEACCHLPFKLEGRMYYDCTFFTKKHLWCGTTPDYDNDRQWGYCCQDGDCT